MLAEEGLASDTIEFDVGLMRHRFGEGRIGFLNPAEKRALGVDGAQPRISIEMHAPTIAAVEMGRHRVAVHVPAAQAAAVAIEGGDVGAHGLQPATRKRRNVDMSSLCFPDIRRGGADTKSKGQAKRIASREETQPPA